MASCLGCQAVAQNNVSKPSDKVELKRRQQVVWQYNFLGYNQRMVLRLESGGEARIPAASVKR